MSSQPLYLESPLPSPPALLAALLLTVPAVFAQPRPPTEDQCRQMVDGMVQTMRATPLKTEREQRDGKALIQRVEQIVRDNRARGASECDSWAAIGKLVAHQ